MTVKGLQNIGAISFKYKIKNCDYEMWWNRLIIQFKDCKSKSQFRDIFEKCPDPLDQKFLIFDDLTTKIDNTTYTSVLNVNFNWLITKKFLDKDGKDIHIVENLAKLIKNISESKNEFPVLSDYLGSKTCRKNVTPSEMIKLSHEKNIYNRFEKEYPIKKIHNFFNVKKVSNIILNDINREIENYFFI